MLEKLRKAIAPATLNAEVVEIEAKLDALDAEREEHRLLAGRLVQAQGTGHDGVREKEARQHHVRIAEIDAQRKELRERRHDLLELLKPAPPAKVALFNVPMSDELAAAIDDLAKARADRQQLIAGRHADDGDAAERKRQRAITEAEERIRVLRIRRAELLEPYNAAVMQALSPHIRKAAQKLFDGAGAMREALLELGEMAQIAPPLVAGQGSGLEVAATINATPCRMAETWALDLLRMNAAEEIPAE